MTVLISLPFHFFTTLLSLRLIPSRASLHSALGSDIAVSQFLPCVSFRSVSVSLLPSHPLTSFISFSCYLPLLFLVFRLLYSSSSSSSPLLLFFLFSLTPFSLLFPFLPSPSIAFLPFHSVYLSCSPISLPLSR